VATARCRTVFSRPAHQVPGIYPLAPGGGRAHALHAGPEPFVSPDLVEHAYSAFRGFDWAEPELVELQTLFLRAGRVIGDRSLDLSMPLRELIARKMENTGVPPQNGPRRSEGSSRWDGPTVPVCTTNPCPRA
jgi:hypothetical protein